jgi:hypothetical protein
MRFTRDVEIGIGDGSGTTRDISAGGVYFSTALPLATGAPVTIHIAGARLQLPFALDVRCQGHVVRVDTLADGWGVAVGFDDVQFESPGRV